MALIKCPECGKEISDKANKCPNCGCPTKNKKKKIIKYNKIIMPIAVIVLAVIVMLIISFGGHNILPRDAKWNENQNSVVKREEKTNGDIYINADIVTIQKIEIFNDTADYIYYKFDENNKLDEIIVRYMTFESYEYPDIINEKFNNIADSVEELLGEPVSSERNTVVAKETWSFKDTYVEMDYSYLYGNIDITYKRK